MRTDPLRGAGAVDGDHTIRDEDAALRLAELVMSMVFVSDAGHKARSLARAVLGIADPTSDAAYRDCVPVTTNGTMRLIPADEPVFLIRGQDMVGGEAVRAWADLAAAAGANPGICDLARQQAGKMDEWPKKKVADHPSVRDHSASDQGARAPR